MQLNEIIIWQPRYHDRKVLINPLKVAAHNKVVFTKAGGLNGEYYISGQVIKSYPKESNGKIDCYCVPLDKLEKIATPEGKI